MLEPIMDVEVVTPDEFMGEVIGDINSRRGRIVQVNLRNNTRVIECEVPLANMFGYATQLRSMTQGRAAYAMEFDHYAECPKNVEAEIVAGNKK